MNRQNKKRMSLLLVFCLLITMGGFGNLKWANAADTTMAVADAEATEEPVPTGVPNYTAEPQATGTDDDFRVGISYVSKDWKESHMTDFTTNQVMQITAEGNYSISYTVGSDYNMDMLWLDTNLYQGSKVEVDVTGVTITSADGTSKSYTVDNGGLKTPGSLWGYRDSSNYNNYAATIVNQYLHYYNYTTNGHSNYNEKYTEYGFNDTDTINMFDQTPIETKTGSKVTLDFTVVKEEDPIVHGTPNYSAEPQTKGTDEDFRVGLTYISSNWTEQNFTDFATEQTMQITKTGDYTISYTTAANDDMLMFWLDTNLYKGSNRRVDVTGVTISSADGETVNEYTLANGGIQNPGSLWGYRNGDYSENYAAMVLNPYMKYASYILPSSTNYRDEYKNCGFTYSDPINMFAQNVKTLGEGTKITVAFTVRADKTTGTPIASPEVSEEPTKAPVVSANPTESTKDPEATKNPSVTPIAPTEPTDGKNANDVAAINKIIADQRAKGATVSENLDDTNQYTWKDGRLVEIKWISKLDTTIDYKLTGDISFNDLTALETIDCSVSYGLTSIEVTDCKALKALKISHSQITTLNIENNVVLQKLDCSCTEISDLDVSHNPELEELDCSSIPINCLDVSHNPELKKVDCGYIQIKHLDVSKLANLQSLSCNSLEIESLDLSSNKKLEVLSFDFCEHISNIDLSNNVMLREVSCVYSSINVLDVSKNVALEKLECYNTNIQSLDVSKNVELQFLICDSTKLTTLDVTCNTKLEYLSCSRTDILYVDIRKCSKMTKEDVYCDYEMLIVYNEETAQIVPECVALHKIVTEQRALGAQIDDYWDGEDYDWENGHLTRIDWLQRGLKGKISFAGLPALEIIAISGNEITELDVSNIPDLKCLECEDNKITRLDIRNNKKLTKFTYDDGVKVIRTDDDLEPSVKPSAAPSVTPSVAPIARPTNKPQKTTAPAAVGTTLKDKNGSYKVVSSNKKQPTISYVQSAKTKAASVTVPDKVTIGGVTYKVTAIAPKAFANNKKLKKVTISKNITSIGKNAFAGCKKLKKITIKSTKLKSSSIGKNAFKGTAKKLIVKVPKKQYKAYKKFLKKKGNKTIKVRKS
ncbi:leucine-rich repeat protein [Clostridium sp. OM05-9BH]|uniref:leucine-rich repeat protein n=1 Tax=Clostridium sp. OM05-9BH TaxID=2293046 RepID=UPI0015FA5FBA|nr:leucine-rich repeat protein [Clostridium sp. OM05-9BH]